MSDKLSWYIVSASLATGEFIVRKEGEGRRGVSRVVPFLVSWKQLHVWGRDYFLGRIVQTKRNPQSPVWIRLTRRSISERGFNGGPAKGAPSSATSSMFKGSAMGDSSQSTQAIRRLERSWPAFVLNLIVPSSFMSNT